MNKVIIVIVVCIVGAIAYNEMYGPKRAKEFLEDADAIPAVNAPQAEPPVVLKLNCTPGTVYRYAAVVMTHLTATQTGKEFETSLDLSYTMTVGQAAGPDRYDLTLIINEISMDMGELANVPGVANSNAELERVKGKPFTGYVFSDGRLEPENTSETGSSYKQMAFTSDYPRFSNKPVGPGDSWESNSDFGRVVSRAQAYEMCEGRRCLKITETIEPAQTVPGMPERVETTLFFDPQDGVIVKESSSFPQENPGFYTQTVETTSTLVE